MDTTSILTDSPESGAADEDPCFACYEGFVFLTYEEDGHEWTEAVPCRRCQRSYGEEV